MYHRWGPSISIFKDVCVYQYPDHLEVHDNFPVITLSVHTHKSCNCVQLLKDSVA